MKNLKNWFKERNNWHKIIAVPAEVALYLLCFQAVQILGKIVISLFIFLVITCLWEGLRNWMYGYAWDQKDINNAMKWAAVTSCVCAVIDSLTR